MARIEADGVRVALGGRPVLRGVCVAAAAGEVVGLIGPNGSGKTTLLGTLAGLVERGGGAVRLDGRDVAALPPEERGRRIGYLEQNPGAHWPLAVERVVMLGRAPHRAGLGGESDADRAAVAAALERCGAAPFAGRPVTTLSGGERARVMLARVLAGQPEVLLADEPVAGLDPYHMLHVMELLRTLSREGMAVVVVLHDLALAIRFCDRLCLLEDGTVAASGPPHAVLDTGDAERVFGVHLLRGPDWAIPWTRREEGR
ncbi:ABC transporter ATP-binding protein [Azospirillum sp. ST 5-10]|uniref:ABC transporter ATP-binding protein n=1 Tax=unclassified Azospirillum TaxID=2630922 RepID=UPI003F4A8203